MFSNIGKRIKRVTSFSIFIGGGYWLVRSNSLNSIVVLIKGPLFSIIKSIIKGPEDDKVSAKTIADLLDNPYDEDNVSKLPEGKLKTLLRGLTGAKIIFTKPVRRKIIQFYRKHIVGTEKKDDESAMEKLRDSILDELDK